MNIKLKTAFTSVIFSLVFILSACNETAKVSEAAITQSSTKEETTTAIQITTAKEATVSSEETTVSTTEQTTSATEKQAVATTIKAETALPVNFKPDYSNANQINTRGNTTANITNGMGIVAQQGDWIYYAKALGKVNQICKMKADGSNQTTICNDRAYDVNVVGDWIYYENGSDKNKLYKIRTDGSGRVKLSDDYDCLNINVLDGWIYYFDTFDSIIYKMKTDGTSRTVVKNDWGLYLNVVDGWIYYSNFGANRNIYKIKTDGTSRQKLNNVESQMPTVYGDWIYYLDYTNARDGGKLFKMRLDGSNNSKISDIKMSHFTIDGDYIYFVEDSKFGRINLDGSNKKEIFGFTTSDNCYYLYGFLVNNGWIYYYTNFGEIYKVKIDGTGCTNPKSIKAAETAVTQDTTAPTPQLKQVSSRTKLDAKTNAVGVWKGYDFIWKDTKLSTIEAYNPNNKNSKIDLFFKTITIKNDGTCTYERTDETFDGTWNNDILTEFGKYYIYSIDGKKYMFMTFENGDGSNLYVFEQ